MSDSAVVLLHGIWMPGAEMLYFKKRLKKLSALACHIYSYRSVRASLQQNADLLYEFVKRLHASEVQLVGHSLGGVVALRMLATHADAPPGRVVCLGSPLCGSKAAEVMVRNRWGRALTGATLGQGVAAEPASTWAAKVVATRDVGIIAGTVPLGLGRLVTQFDGDNDGTVAVNETRLPGAAEHLCLPVNHTGLVTSREAIAQTGAFIGTGRFNVTR